MNLEGGAGGDFLKGRVTAGLVYYASFKLSRDQIEGFPDILIRGKNRSFALGPEVSLTLERGALSVLLGPTLSGKTSIMRLLAGLDKPTEGRILVDGKDVTGLDVRKRSVAMVYQQFIN